MAAKAFEKLSCYRLPLLALLVAVLFLPSLKNGYVGWDDALIHSNQIIRSLSVENLLEMFVPPAGRMASYQPLRSLAYALVYAVNGPRPFGFLLFNIILYIVNILLFYKVVKHLFLANTRQGSDQRAENVALVASAVFAFHPVHVEAVSWLQGGKQSLMAAFFLASFFYYLRFKSEKKGRFYRMSFFFYLVALASQPGALALPLLILGYEMVEAMGKGGSARKQWPGVLLGIIPFFLPAILLGIQLLLISSVRIDSPGSPSLMARIFTVPVLWGKSLLKLFLPVNICCRYPLSVPNSPPLLAGSTWALILACIGWAAYHCAGRGRQALLAPVWFAATLLPTSGLVATSTLMADRYLYLPSMGFALLLALIFSRFSEVSKGQAPEYKTVSPLFALLFVIFASSMASVTFKRQFDWRDGTSLWSRVVALYPDHALGTFNLAEAYIKDGRRDEAAELYRRVLEINPDYGDAYINLAAYFRQRGEHAKAQAHLDQALVLSPEREELWINLGINYYSLGQDSAALAAFEKVIELEKGMVWSAYFNRGIMMLERGFEEQAVKDLEAAARYRPSQLTTETWIKLGKVLEKIGRRELAVELLSLGTGEPAFEAACWRLLGRLQIQAGHSRKAVESLENALRLGGEDYHTLVLLGLASQQAGFVKKAIESYRHALVLSGENRAEILNNLGQVLAETGKLDQAEESYREALQIRSDYIDAWVNLAILYRKKGDFSGSRRSIERALELCAGRADSAGLKEYLQAILDRLPPG